MMTVAEHFRDQGGTCWCWPIPSPVSPRRRASLAAAAAEPFGPSGFPASMAQMIMALAERAGPRR
jgi:flagellum-specific ATP synthase